MESVRTRRDVGKGANDSTYKFISKSRGISEAPVKDFDSSNGAGGLREVTSKLVRRITPDIVVIVLSRGVTDKGQTVGDHADMVEIKDKGEGVRSNANKIAGTGESVGNIGGTHK